MGVRARYRFAVRITAALLLAAAPALCGCSSARQGLVFSFWGDENEIANYKRMVARFEELHPDIHVKMEHIPRSYEDKIMAELAGNAAPDVMVFQDEPLPMFASRGVFRPLDDLIERDGIDLDEFFPQCVQGHTYNGHIYGLPKDGGAVVLFYNKRLFDEAGLDYPNEDWTWDDFLAAAKALTRDNDGDGQIDQCGTQVSAWWAYWLIPIWSAGGRFLNEERTECVVNSPEALRGIRWYAELRTKHKVVPEPGQLEGVADAFQAGKIAMQFTGPWSVISLRDIESFQWDVTFVPKGPAGRWTRYTGDAYCMWAGTRRVEDAWTFIKWMSGEEASKMNALAQRAVPARKAIANSDIYIREDTPWDESVFVRAFEHARVQPITTKWGEMNTLANQVFEKVLLQKITPEMAVRTLDEEIDKMLSEPD